jgi:hypothetical protein
MKKNANEPRPRDASLWDDDANPRQLGCSVCPDLGLCGGLRIKAHAFDCSALCACAHGGMCSGLCRRDARTFVARVREISGFDLGNVARCRPLALPQLSEYVPIVYHGTSREGGLDAGMVALPLAALFNRRGGAARYCTRGELLAAFRLAANTRLMVTGVADDKQIEAWWGFRHRPRLIEHLRALGVELVTSPNYSLFTNVSRYDNFHNMKRIGIVTAEFMAAGMPCALHVNGRNDRDYERWSDHVAERDEISMLAFEFTTGTASTRRSVYHQRQLVRIAQRAGRPLHLVVRGGVRHLPELMRAFASVSVVDGEPFVKTTYRQKGFLEVGASVGWQQAPTSKGESLDALLRHNIRLKRLATARRLAWIRADHAHAETGGAGALLEACSA